MSSVGANLAYHLQCSCPPPRTAQAIYWVDEPARKGMLVRWTMAFSRVLLVHVRADVDLEDQLRGLLLPAEVEAVVAVGPEGAPSFVLQVRREGSIWKRVGGWDHAMYTNPMQLGMLLAALMCFLVLIASTSKEAEAMLAVIWCAMVLPALLPDQTSLPCIPYTYPLGLPGDQRAGGAVPSF